MQSTLKTFAAPLTLAIAFGLAACQTTTPTTATKGVCAVWLGIDYSASLDTPETVLGVRRNNARRDEFCK